jgi:hypothetical protein
MRAGVGAQKTSADSATSPGSSIELAAARGVSLLQA